MHVCILIQFFQKIDHGLQNSWQLCFSAAAFNGADKSGIGPSCALGAKCVKLGRNIFWVMLINIPSRRRAWVILWDTLWGILGKNVTICDFILKFDSKKICGKKWKLQICTNTLQELMDITDVVYIIQLTHRVCFSGCFQQKRLEKVRFWGSDNKDLWPENRSWNPHSNPRREFLIIKVISKVVKDPLRDCILG